MFSKETTLLLKYQVRISQTWMCNKMKTNLTKICSQRVKILQSVHCRQIMIIWPRTLHSWTSMFPILTCVHIRYFTGANNSWSFFKDLHPRRHWKLKTSNPKIATREYSSITAQDLPTQAIASTWSKEEMAIESNSNLWLRISPVMRAYQPLWWSNNSTSMRVNLRSQQIVRSRTSHQAAMTVSTQLMELSITGQSSTKSYKKRNACVNLNAR